MMNIDFRFFSLIFFKHCLVCFQPLLQNTVIKIDKIKIKYFLIKLPKAAAKSRPCGKQRSMGKIRPWNNILRASILAHLYP